MLALGFRSGDRPTGNYWSSTDEHLTDGLDTDGLATIRPESRKNWLYSASNDAVGGSQQLAFKSES